MRIFGVILAGGQGRRMGGADKALLPFGKGTLAGFVTDRFEPQVEQLCISANGDPARLAALGLPVLPDTESMGPLSGILSALIWAKARGADALVSVAVDTPFLPPDMVPRLCLAAERSPEGLAHAASGGNDHPTCALWPTDLAPALQEFLASGVKARVRNFAADHGSVRAQFPDDGSFVNLNTPDDLAMANAMLRRLA